jgi:hypothetical protein
MLTMARAATAEKELVSATPQEQRTPIANAVFARRASFVIEASHTNFARLAL